MQRGFYIQFILDAHYNKAYLSKIVYSFPFPPSPEGSLTADTSMLKTINSRLWALLIGGLIFTINCAILAGLVSMPIFYIVVTLLVIGLIATLRWTATTSNNKTIRQVLAYMILASITACGFGWLNIWLAFHLYPGRVLDWYHPLTLGSYFINALSVIFFSLAGMSILKHSSAETPE